MDALPSPGELEDHVRQMAMEWDHRGESIDHMLDRLMASLAETASHDIRQLLARLSTELELAELTTEKPGACLENASLQRLLTTLEQACGLVDSYLDRNAIARAVIQLETEVLDLADLVDRLFDREGLDPADERIEVTTESVVVDVDAEKTYRVLEFLVSSFRRASPPEGRLRVDVRKVQDRAEGFVGIDPAPWEREDLVGKLSERLDITGFEVDVPYIRAVLERHGGLLVVEGREPNFLGYKFVLPAGQTGPRGSPGDLGTQAFEQGLSSVREGVEGL